MGAKKALRKFGLVTLLLSISTLAVGSNTEAVIVGRAIKDKSLLNNMTLVSRNGNKVGRLFHGEQDSLETDVLYGVTDLGVGTDLAEYDIGQDGNVKLGFDVRPRKRVFNINAGTVKDGVPSADAESYFMVLDTFQTRLSASGNVKTNDIGDGVSGGIRPLSYDAIEVVRKTSIVRDSTASRKEIENTRDRLAPLRAKPMDTSKPKFKVKFISALKAGFNILTMGYLKLGEAFASIYRNFADSTLTTLISQDPFASVDMKNRLFYVNDQTVLKNLNYGETLSIVRYKQFGYLGAGLKTGILKTGVIPMLNGITERTIERVAPSSECKSQKQIGGKNECSDVLVTIRKSTQTGWEWTQLRAAADLFAGLSFKFLTPKRRAGKFYEVEWVYRINLAEQDGVDAFNQITDKFDPEWDTMDKMTPLRGSENVKLVSAGWRGKDPDIVDEQQVDPKFNKDSCMRADKLLSKLEKAVDKGADPRRGCFVKYDGKLDLVLYKNQWRMSQDQYESCMVNYELAEKENRPVVKMCESNGISQEYHRIRNDAKLRIRFALKYWWRLFIKDIQMYSDNEASFRGVEFRADGQDKLYNGGKPADGEDKELQSVNTHFWTEASDRRMEDYKYNRAILRNTAMLLAVDNLPELYETDENAKKLKERIDELRAADRDPIEGTRQAVLGDVYMSGKFSNHILTKSSEEVRAVVAEMITGGHSWDQLMNAHGSCSDFKSSYGISMGFDCESKQLLATNLLQLFREVQALNNHGKIGKMLSAYTERNRPPYLSYLMLVLGKDVAAEMVKSGDLALRMRSEASDFKPLEQMTQELVGAVEKLQMITAVGRPEFGNPPKGLPRLFNYKVKFDKSKNPTDPNLILLFESSVAQSNSGQKIAARGYLQEYRSIRADKNPTAFEVQDLSPIDGRMGLYQFAADMGPISKIYLLNEKGQPVPLSRNKNYVFQFYLMEHQEQLPFGNGDFEPKILTEPRETSPWKLP